MKRYLLTLLLLPIATGQAQTDEEAVAKLRDALRGSMVQLRDAQAQIANLQASEIAKDQEIAKLKADLKKLADQAMEDKNAAANTISSLREELDKKNASIAGYLRALEKWKQDFGTLTERYRKTSAERDKLQSKSVALERKVIDQQFRNVEMYRVGMDILDRYEKFWFGDALIMREPFTGIARANLEKLIQEKQDALLAARIVDTGKEPQPAPSPAAEAPAPEPTATPQARAAAEPPPSPTPKATPKGQKPKRGETAWPEAQPAA